MTIRAIIGQMGTAKHVVTMNNDATEVLVQTHEDVTRLVDSNKVLQNNPELVRRNTPDGWRLKARLPITLYRDLSKQGILNDKKRFRAWLNDPDNRHFLTTLGRI